MSTDEFAEYYCDDWTVMDNIPKLERFVFFSGDILRSMKGSTRHKKKLGELQKQVIAMVIRWRNAPGDAVYLVTSSRRIILCVRLKHGTSPFVAQEFHTEESVMEREPEAGFLIRNILQDQEDDEESTESDSSSDEHTQGSKGTQVSPPKIKSGKAKASKPALALTAAAGTARTKRKKSKDKAAVVTNPSWKKLDTNGTWRVLKTSDVPKELKEWLFIETKSSASLNLRDIPLAGMREAPNPYLKYKVLRDKIRGAVMWYEWGVEQHRGVLYLVCREDLIVRCPENFPDRPNPFYAECIVTSDTVVEQEAMVLIQSILKVTEAPSRSSRASKMATSSKQTTRSSVNSASATSNTWGVLGDDDDDDEDDDDDDDDDDVDDSDDDKDVEVVSYKHGEPFADNVDDEEESFIWGDPPVGYADEAGYGDLPSLASIMESGFPEPRASQQTQKPSRALQELMRTSQPSTSSVPSLSQVMQGASGHASTQLDLGSVPSLSQVIQATPNVQAPVQETNKVHKNKGNKEQAQKDAGTVIPSVQHMLQEAAKSSEKRSTAHPEQRTETKQSPNALSTAEAAPAVARLHSQPTATTTTDNTTSHSKTHKASSSTSTTSDSSLLDLCESMEEDMWADEAVFRSMVERMQVDDGVVSGLQQGCPILQHASPESIRAMLCINLFGALEDYHVHEQPSVQGLSKLFAVVNTGLVDIDNEFLFVVWHQTNHGGMHAQEVLPEEDMQLRSVFRKWDGNRNTPIPPRYLPLGHGDSQGCVCVCIPRADVLLRKAFLNHVCTEDMRQRLPLSLQHVDDHELRRMLRDANERCARPRYVHGRPVIRISTSVFAGHLQPILHLDLADDPVHIVLDYDQPSQAYVAKTIVCHSEVQGGDVLAM